MNNTKTGINFVFLAYAFPWLFVLYLYQLELSERLVPLTLDVFLYIFSTIIFFWIGLGVKFGMTHVRDSCHKIPNNIFYDVQKIIPSKKFKIFKILIYLSYATEVIYFRNLPLLSSLGIGPEVRYTDFGFKGLHGLFNAMFLIYANIKFIDLLISRKPFFHSVLNFIVIIMWPVLLEGRQLLMSLLIQWSVIYFLIYGISYKRSMKIAIYFSVVLLIFGFIGDIRSGRDGLISVAAPTFDYPEYLPSALLWVYIYVCSPFNNVIYNFGSITPNYMPINIISSIFPSTISGEIKNIIGGNKYNWELVYEILNVSSIHEKLLLDLGAYGSIILFLCMGIFCRYLFIRRNNGFKYFNGIVVVVHGLVLSIFGDFIFNLVFASQVIIGFLLFKKKWI